MAKGLLGLDIGNSFIRYVYLEKVNGDYCVLKAGKSRATLALSAQGPLFHPISEILAREQISPERIFMTLSLNHFQAQQMSLYKMSQREYEEVIQGEIEKVPQFAQAEFEYIYKAYPQTRDKSKIFFVGIPKKELLTFINEIQKTEIPFNHLEISPLNLKEFLPLIDAASPHSSEAILMIHDQHSYLAIVKGNRYEMLYKFSNGLNDLDLGKPEVDRRKIIANWSSEIKRVLKSFDLENRQNIVQRIRLVWDREQYPELEQNFSDQLGIPVEALALHKAKKIRTLENYPLNPIYALALTPVVCWINAVKEDFPLKHFFRSVQLKKYLLKNAVTAVLIAAAVGAFSLAIGMGFSTRAKNLQLEARKAQAQIVQLQAEASSLYQIQKEYEETRKRLLDQASYIQQVNRVSWSEVLAIIASEMPADLALTDFKFSESGQATIKGEAFQMESVSELIRRTEASQFLERGKFDFLRERNAEDIKYYEFGIFANLKKMEDSSNAADTQKN